MALIASIPPKKAADAVNTTFLDFNKNRTFKSPSLRNATGDLQLTEPHQVFTLGLSDLVNGKGLDAAKPTGWRYFVQQGDNVLASAQSGIAGSSGEHVFSAFSESRFVASSADAIRAAKEFPEVKQGGFELRLLSVPGLYVEALWLHDPQGKNDILIPLAPSPLELQLGSQVSVATLLKELVSKAKGPIEAADLTGG